MRAGEAAARASVCVARTIHDLEVSKANSSVDVSPGKAAARQRARSGLTSALACSGLCGALDGMNERPMSRMERLGAIVARLRKYAGYWSWPDKRRRELGVVEELLNAMRSRGAQGYRSPESAPEDPPDCTMRAVDGSLVAVEVTELVCKEAARRNQRGQRVYRDCGSERARNWRQPIYGKM